MAGGWLVVGWVLCSSAAHLLKVCLALHLCTSCWAGVLPNLHNSLQSRRGWSREPAPAAGANQGQPARSGSQIRIKGRGGLPSRRLDAGMAASQQPRGAQGAEGTPTGGNPQRPALGSPPHHATQKRTRRASPAIPLPYQQPKKNSPCVCPAFIAVVGVLLRVVAAAGGSSWVDSLWLPVERSEWL